MRHFVPAQLFATATTRSGKKVHPLRRIEEAGKVFYQCLTEDRELIKINETKLKFETSHRSRMTEVGRGQEALRVVLSEGARGKDNAVSGRADLRKALRREMQRRQDPGK